MKSVRDLMKNQTGLSRLQALIAGGLVGLTLLSMLILGRMFNRALNSSTTKFNAVFMINNMRTLLSSPKVCRENFEGMILGQSNELKFLKNQFGVKKYSLKNLYFEKSLRIKKIKIADYNYSKMKDFSHFSVMLKVIIEKMDGHKVINASEYNIPLNLNVKNSNGNQEIIDCSTKENLSSAEVKALTKQVRELKTLVCKSNKKHSLCQRKGAQNE
jgi:hypothetical protein